MSRQDHTTRFIREAVVDELVQAGHSALTMESIARRSYSSIGSVYSRYPNRVAAMRDALHACVLPVLGDRAPGPGADVYGWAATDPQVMRHIRALVEIALCSRFEPDLTAAGGALRSIVTTGTMGGTDGPRGSGLDWLVGTVLVGHVVLSGAGCTVPDVVGDLSVLVRRASSHSDDAPAVARGVTAPIPGSPVPRADDDVAAKLVDSTTEELAASGASRANVRRIARRSGVTTGAVYRRYGSKTELVRDALVRELQPSRYSWTEALVDSVRGADGTATPGDILADQIFSLLNDRTRTLATLEMIHAARTDDSVRQTLVTQVEDAAAARAQLFASVPRDAREEEPVSPVLMGWVIQMAPTGARVLVALGDEPDEDSVRAALRDVMRTALS